MSVCKFTCDGKYFCTENLTPVSLKDIKYYSEGVDKKPECKQWALSNQCLLNPDFMNLNCPNNCAIINKDKDLGSPGECKKLLDEDLCNGGDDKWSMCAKTCTTANIDLDSNCPNWAESGECKNNPNYMSVNCRKSCNIDLDPNCPKWAESGECSKNPKYMLINCKNSCDNVNNVDLDTVYCPNWAKHGYCTDNRYKKYVQSKCKKSCIGKI